MKLLSALFLASLLLGQIGGIPVYPGVVIYIHDILLVILLVEGFVQYAMRGTLVKPKLFGAIALFTGVAVISLLANSGIFPLFSLEISGLYLVRWVFYALSYVLVVQEFVAPWLWLLGLYLTGVGLALLGFVQFFLYPDLRNLSYLGWDPHFYRLFSTFLDPNFAGIYLVLTFCLGIYFWHAKKFRLYIALGEVVTLLGLFLTYSRSSFLAFLAVIVVFALYKKSWMLWAAMGAFIIAVIFFPKMPASALSLLRSDSAFARIGNWQDGIKLMGEAPVFGHGFDTLRYLTTVAPNTISKAAAGLDSSILFVGATTGFIGLAAYGYLIFSMLKIGRKNIVYIASFVALGVDSFFVNSAFYPWILIWFWILTGVLERSFDSKTRSG